MTAYLRYQRLSGLGEMLLSVFEKPAEVGLGQWLSIPEISARLKSTFRGAYQEDEGTFEKIGRFLSRPEYKFESERKTKGVVYLVKERE